MQSKRIVVALSVVMLLPLGLTMLLSAGEKKPKFSCSQSNPAGICSAATTCGSPTTPCKVDIKRSGSTYATATPEIENAKGNMPFCVKVGTSITFYTTSKDTGFVLDFGATSPFDVQGAIMGGADRPVTVVAKRAGCYRYTAGACTAGTIYGMCGSAPTELVVTGAN